MTQEAAHIAAHPVRTCPYDKLRFARLDHNRTPLYSVDGVGGAECGPYKALGRALGHYGGRCFYCGRPFKPQAFSPGTVHRDHVFPKTAGGLDLLHNLVIACQPCGRLKAADPIHEFRPKAAKEYLAALEAHVARCVRQPPGG
jgi:5-methylcytosine-specific restriction endonuclease McrA